MTRFSVVHGDVQDIPSDLLLLKYANAHFGADEVVSERLAAAGVCQLTDTCPESDSFSIIPTNRQIAPDVVMFVGTIWLSEFAYDEMREFAIRAMRYLSEQQLSVRIITTTIHGAAYGLDAEEALHSLVLGFTQGLMKHPGAGVQWIRFVERNKKRVRQLQQSLGALGTMIEADSATPPPQNQETTIAEPDLQRQDSDQLGSPSKAVPDFTLSHEPAGTEKPKEHIFVAMPFTEEFEDVYEFGIYGPVRNCGYICEKVNQTSFTGDILQRIRQRISTAKLVVADLSEARPNVYLEVGYAWGMNVPVVFLARKGQTLHFDVQMHNCIFYSSIRQLARELETLLRDLGSHSNSDIMNA